MMRVNTILKYKWEDHHLSGAIIIRFLVFLFYVSKAGFACPRSQIPILDFWRSRFLSSQVGLVKLILDTTMTGMHNPISGRGPGNVCAYIGRATRDQFTQNSRVHFRTFFELCRNIFPE